MCYKEWPECYKHCDNCDNLRHKDDLILVTDGAVDPDEKMICAQCASKQLSALRNEVRAWRDAEHLRRDEPHAEFMRLAEARARTRETQALTRAKEAK